MMNESPISNSAYWNQRYLDENTPWDLGRPSMPMTSLIEELNDKQLRILLPGAGTAWEAGLLFKLGFENVFVLDWSEKAGGDLFVNFPDFPADHFFLEDFFFHNQHYDLILEQTFMCALPPEMRAKYAQKLQTLLNKGGKVAGVFFDFPLTEKGPPFGGSEAEYRSLFSPCFEIVRLERCQNSEPDRQGKELVFEFVKR